MDLVKTDKRKEVLKDVEENLHNTGGRLYLYGCSRTARMITEFVQKNSGLAIEGYVVDDPYYKGGSFNGKPILKRSEWEKELKEGDWVIFGFTGSKRAEELAKELPSILRYVYFHFPYSANVDGSCLSYEFCKEQEEKFEKTYELLGDGRSKEIMTAFMNACISGETEALEKLRSDGQYFNELTKNCKEGCFIDCGAYIGDTIEEAAAFLGDRLLKVIAFEPDEKNLSALSERMERLNIKEDRLSLIQKGSYSKKAVLHFSSSDSSSSISEEGDLEIRVDSVDCVVDEEDFVSFIKMDVEGSEKESLLGAAKTIQKDAPILAVCVYHKPEDLYELPGLIRELTKETDTGIDKGDGYRFYLRYHGPDLRELVFYAIPE